MSAKGFKSSRTGGAAPRRKQRRAETYSSYIYKIVKEVNPSASVGKKTMRVLNSIINDVFERVIEEAGTLARKEKKATLQARDVEYAVRTILPAGELNKHALSEGTKAVIKFQSQ